MGYKGTTAKPKEGESLADLFPNVASQWHPTLNGDLTPKNVKAVTSKTVYWKCPEGPDHEWKTQIRRRTELGRRCPFCLNQRLSITNSLEATHPELASEWHPTLNGDLLPATVLTGSRQKVWWKCDVADDHEWEAYCPDLLEELLVVTPIKAIEHAVSQNGHDSSELHRVDPEATMRRILAIRGL